MMKTLLPLLLLLLATPMFAQNNSEMAIKKAKEAIKLMDDGEVEKSIKLLEESQRLDPENYIYPYEIAYAYILQKEYEEAVKILTSIQGYKNLRSEVYQMLGNCYSFLDDPDKAIQVYEEGMKRFPNAGNLHLEKGNIYLHQKQYEDAARNYENGIKADPMFPSNYYRLALLYLESNDKLSGMIYGEIFMNLERTTARTQEMSELLYKAYHKAITLGESESKIDFCDIIIDDRSFLDGELHLPLCAIFGKNFLLGTIGHKEFTLTSLSSMRSAFIQYFYQEDFQQYPNVLFAYQKKLADAGLLEAYNHYLFQVGTPDEFRAWKEENEEKYDQFVSWYTQRENIIEITKDNLFIK